MFWQNGLLDRPREKKGSKGRLHMQAHDDAYHTQAPCHHRPPLGSWMSTYLDLRGDHRHTRPPKGAEEVCLIWDMCSA